MKVAVISAIPPFPCDAGNRAKVLSLARALKDVGHDVHFIYLDLWTWEHADRGEIEAFFGEGHVHWLKGETPKLTKFSDRLARYVGRRLKAEWAYRYGLDDWYDPSLNASLEKLQATEGFEAVFVEYVFSSKAFAAFGEGALKVLDTHDEFGDRHKRLMASGCAPSWYSTSLAQETAGFRRADVILAIQSEEAERFRERVGAEPPRVTVVSHILDLAPVAGLRHSPAASFVSSKNAINVIAIEKFIDQALPLIVKRAPNFKLYMAGSICDLAPDHPNVVKMGVVKDLADVYRVGPISINPVLAGTGINIKVLEAMASGVPVVTTETGARGLSAYADALCVVPDEDWERFAETILALCDDAQAWSARVDKIKQAAAHWNELQFDALRSTLTVQRGASA